MNEPTGTFRWASVEPSPLIPTVAELEAAGWVKVAERPGGRWLMKLSDEKEEQAWWP